MNFTDYRQKALIMGLYQQAFKEQKEGNTELARQLRVYQKITQGPQELGFFLDGETIGYTPEAEGTDYQRSMVEKCALFFQTYGRKIGTCILGGALGASIVFYAARMGGEISDTNTTEVSPSYEMQAADYTNTADTNTAYTNTAIEHIHSKEECVATKN